MLSPQPFRLRVPDDVLADLKHRLNRTRFPDQLAANEDWLYGTEKSSLQNLTAYWLDGYDWRLQESRFNALPQYKLPIRGLDMHFIHVRAKDPAAPTLLLVHGWPGSVFEFHKLIQLLVNKFNIVYVHVLHVLCLN